MEDEVTHFEEALDGILFDRDGPDGAELDEVISPEEQSPAGFPLRFGDRVDRHSHFEVKQGDETRDDHSCHHA